MTDSLSRPAGGVRRGWLVLAAIGVALVAIALITVVLVLADKTHFGNLVGPRFLPVLTSGVVLGAILVVLGTWMLPVRRTWKGAVLFAWAIVALISPWFGYLFLIPWCVLALTLPLIVGIVIGLFRGR
ncbi:MAG TPA: hypothetical protein VKB93_07210 [Thermoanaerobaculia bacterium]|nr:hypothetical protein [Thermoanaerobaculia bacterium]